MNFLIIGNEQKAEELISACGDSRDIEVREFDQAKEKMKSADLIVDLEADYLTERFDFYSRLSEKLILLPSVFHTLADLSENTKRNPSSCLAGINHLPTFIGRELKECTFLDKKSKEKAEEVFEKLDWKVEWVQDRVGMVTPRIVCMIINEAAFTLQEGTATIRDIDLGMKLGTNYPRGPFEWADAIGVDNVCKLLEAIYKDTFDERYKICPVLKRQNALRQPFIVK